MYINEYGNRSDPTIILMAPLLVSGTDLYQNMSVHFRGSYHIIAPDQGGHGKGGNYLSAGHEYARLKSFLSEQGIRKIALAYGASLGAAIAYRLFLDPDFEVEHAWLDGAVLNEKAGTVERYMNSMFKNQKKRLTGPEIEIPAGLIKDYGHDFAGMMTGNLVQLTLKDAEAISHACCHYDLRPLTRQEQRKLHLDYGEKDFALKYSKKALSRHMPEAETAVRKGCSHCGYMAAHMKKYVEKMEDFIKMRPA